jgi:hypothetical protein
MPSHEGVMEEWGVVSIDSNKMVFKKKCQKKTETLTIEQNYFFIVVWMAVHITDVLFPQSLVRYVNSYLT